MKTLPLSVLFSCLAFPYCVTAQEWKNECIGYYQLQLPDNLEVALYPIEDFVNPKKQPESDGDIKTRLYASPGITFDKTYYKQKRGAVQAQFTELKYGKYELGISSESPELIGFSAYKERAKDNIIFWNNVRKQYEALNFRMFKEPIMPEAEFNQRYGYLIKDYPDAFTIYESRGYTVYINKERRLYHFWGDYQKNTGDKSQTAEKQLHDSEPEVLSLLNRFRPRKLYEVPTEQGFCLPYGFIAGDSGHEKRNMGVTYRLKDHPDVSIFFQDLGPNPGPGEQRPYERRPDEKMSAKDYVTYFWNRRYGHSFREIKLYGKGFSSPKIDHRDGAAAFAKFTRRSKEVDFGYMAYVKGNAENTEPGLLFYVIRDSRQAKDQLPMDKDELEKIAEHIVSSIKRR